MTRANTIPTTATPKYSAYVVILYKKSLGRHDNTNTQNTFQKLHRSFFNSSELNPPLLHWTNKHHHCNLHKKVYIRHNYHRIGNTVGKDIRNTTAANLVPSSPFSQIQSDSHTHPTYILTHFRKLIKIITQNSINQLSTRPKSIICSRTGIINITTAISIKYYILDILDIVSALKPAQIFEIPPPPACYRHHPIVKSYQIHILIIYTYVHISGI